MERARVAPRRGTKNVSTATVPEAPAIGDDEPPRTASEPYTVVARRYRPQRFEEVVGQDHVVRALRNAIRLNRIAQAYLFCGTRGVGKTTMARILAKCLNCAASKGPTDEPCQVCDICRAISQGQDVDVIEIDGASNNGVEQVRELRQNAGLRPSRARYKVYYIDEVHMLSTGAFNALLKTLEEPPPHVKFIFATTEANKIPDTVLSRCQRYDLAGIAPQLIARTLGEICEHEQVAADPEALHVVARRAAGSMRDAESLLERLLASGSPRLTVEVVQGLLGTASDERLLAMLEALADHDAAEALRLLEQAADQGVQPVDVLDGLLEFLRDAMVLALGADSILLAITPRQKPRLQAIVERFPIDAIYAAFQILDQHRMRLRGSLHGRLLVEMALVRVARLEDLESLDNVIERLAAMEAGGPLLRRPEARAAKKRAGGLKSRAAKRSRRRPRSAIRLPRAAMVASPPRGGPAASLAVARRHKPRPPRSRSPLDLEAAQRVWAEAAGPDDGESAVAAHAGGPRRHRRAGHPGHRAEAGLLCHRRDHRLGRGPGGRADGAPALVASPGRSPLPADERVRRRAARRQRSWPRGTRRADADPLVQKVIELFEARPVQMDYDGPEADHPA